VTVTRRQASRHSPPATNPVGRSLKLFAVISVIAVSVIVIVVSAVGDRVELAPFLGFLVAGEFLVLYWAARAAYLGRATMKSDSLRLDGLQRVSRLLTAKGDSDEVIAKVLVEISRAFEAEAAELIVERAEGLVITRASQSGAESYVRTVDTVGHQVLRMRLLQLMATTRVTAADSGELGNSLRDDGYEDCLVAGLPGRDAARGCLVVYNQAEIDGRSEIAVMEALAREISSSFEKGALFAAIIEERYKLSRIVDSTSDGVLTLSSDGVIRSWNPGWEQISGVLARDAVGHHLSGIVQLQAGHQRVELDSWSTAFGPLPDELQLIDRSGNRHWLQCSYRAEVNETVDEGLLIVVAHDKTGEHQIEQLREDVDRLAELEAAQRAMVLQVQESLQPGIPLVTEAEFGAFYQPSDTTAPTGGDFYDWQVLPGGNVHIAVVDVLGSGIEATNDAFAVIHTLRTLAYQGIPVDQLVIETDNLLATLNPDLVATVLCVRYNPTLGRARLAGGGHPPALLVRSNGEVEEISAPGIPVGWPGAGSDHAVDVVLEHSDMLVLYTDGIVEAHRDILQGISALSANAAQTREHHVDDLARILVERSLEGAARRDDSLALVVRHCGIGLVEAGERFCYRSRPETIAVADVRHKFASWLQDQPEASVLAEDLSVVMSELAANSARLAESFFEVRASLFEGGVVLEVEDDGAGFDYRATVASPSVEAESGRGLLIVRAMVDDLTVRRTARGCIARVITMIPKPSGAHSWTRQPVDNHRGA
jgi:PAS domain S-box-containing protein